MISICMLKICGESILKSTELISKSCTETEKFIIEWKKANIVPVHKKRQKAKGKLSSDFVAAYLL